MWKSSEVYNINNIDPKTLPWGTPETTSTDALTLPFKSTPCFLSLRNSYSMDNNCPPTPIDFSLYNRLQWLTLSNTAEKSNWTSLSSMPLSKAICRWWDNVSKASHVPRPLRYKNWKGGLGAITSFGKMFLFIIRCRTSEYFGVCLWSNRAYMIEHTYALHLLQ